MFYEKIGTIDDYPDDINDYIQNFKINTIIVLKDSNSKRYKFNKYKKVYENQLFKVYEI